MVEVLDREESSLSHLYSVFGLRVRSNRPLSALGNAAVIEDGGPADLGISEQPRAFLRELRTTGPRGHWVREINRERVVVVIDGIGALRVMHGRIDFSCEHKGTWIELQGYVLGLALGVALYQLGYVPFHLSGCALNGRVIAFGGASGAGKSSFASAMSLRLGGDVVCDDICRIDGNGSTASIFPGISAVRLIRDSLQMLRSSAPRMIRARRDEKGAPKYRVDGMTRTKGPLPLGALVWIEPGTASQDAAIVQQNSVARLKTWIDSLYAPDFGRQVAPWPAVLAAALVLAKRVPVYHMVRGTDISRLASDCERVLDVVGRIPDVANRDAEPEWWPLRRFSPQLAV